jgi:hypothetical protein
MEQMSSVSKARPDGLARVAPGALAGSPRSGARLRLKLMAMHLFRPSPKSTGLHLELMSNKDLDDWLEGHSLS